MSEPALESAAARDPGSVMPGGAGRGLRAADDSGMELTAARRGEVPAAVAETRLDEKGRLVGEVLATWVERYEGELRRHLIGMLRGKADAEDVLQEVWMTAHRNPPDTGPGSNLRAWLYRVATNRALDRLAADKRRLSALRGQRFSLQPEPGPRPDAGLRGLDEEDRARIRAHVARLPCKQREAVWLRWIEGRDYGTIAERLDCSRDSARANVYNGIKRLRSELFDLWKREMGP